jgi:hypothetical protein
MVANKVGRAGGVADGPAELRTGRRDELLISLSADLRREFPNMKGLSPTNLDYMRRLAAAWKNEISPQAVGKLHWGHNRLLLDDAATKPEIPRVLERAGGVEE